METHLEENISVHKVAKASGYSYYHFTRIFQSVLGESIGNYIQKRRLSSASQKLLYSDRKIIDIAIESGFDSSESFSRAFKNVYQVSPSVYRKNRLDVFLGNKTMINREFLHHISSNITVQPQIRNIGVIHVAGIRGTAALDNIFSLWEQFGENLDRIPNKQVIGVEVTSCDNMPADIIVKTIPAGRYAVFTHKGSLEGILKTYQYIWGTWAMLTSETIDNRDDFELYDDRFVGRKNDNSEIDIYIPIK